MKLIYRIALRLSAVLIPLMALWATLFYFMTVDEINDEADDALADYSELIIVRMLAGRELPPHKSNAARREKTACPFVIETATGCTERCG